MIDADDGPCPRLLPVAPYIGAFGQRLDFGVERVEAFGLVVVKLVAVAELVGFAFRLGERLGLFRRQRLRLALHFPETVAVRRAAGSGMISTHFQPSCRTASASRSSFSFTSRSSNAGSVR